MVDFTGELGPYAARLFAGLDADVIHLEPIDGDPLRTRGPFYRNEPGRDRSLAFLYYNAGKRGLALDLGSAPGRQIFRQLCGRAGLLIESTAPGYLESLGLGFEALRQSNPRLVQTSISLFGHSGPYRTLPGSDITCAALGGFLFLGGVGDDKPVRACDNQAFRMAEAYGAAASAAAVLYAQRTGTGQFVDVSCQEAAATALENAPQYYDLEGKIRRGRGREAGNGTIHPCRDGYVVLVAVMGRNKAMWDAFVGWMKHAGAEEWQTFEDEKWIEPDFRSSAEGYESFCRIFERYAAKHAKTYLYETGQRQRVAVSPVSNGRDLLENPQLRHRHFWRQLHHERLGGNVTFPGAPVRFSRLTWRIDTPAPTLGQHTEEILRELGYTPGSIQSLAEQGVVRLDGEMVRDG